MFRKPQKNYVELNMRVSYDEKTDSVNITSKDKNIPAHSGGFRLTLNGGREAEQTLREMLQDVGIITDEHLIPSALHYEKIAASPWDEFPLGQAGGSMTATWNPKHSANLLLTGPAGSGKSILQRNLIFHCLQHPSRWRIYGMEPHHVELRRYKKYTPVVESVVSELKDVVEVCRFLKEKMMERYQKMELLGVNNYQDLPGDPHAIMVLMDEAGFFLAQTGVKTAEGIAEDKLRGEIYVLIAKIARLGRAAGIHLVLSSQRPDVKSVPRELANNLTTKIVMGWVDAIHSRMVLGDEEATRIQWKLKGRGYIQHKGRGNQFQAAFAPLDWYDELLTKNPHLNWPGAQTDTGGIAHDHYIPSKVSYDDIANSRWDEFPLGKAGGSIIANWTPNNSAHLLISGSVGSGKSVIERNLVFHCLQHPDKWRVWGIDLARWELASLSQKYAPVIERIAVDMEAALEICRAALDEMIDRHEKMKTLGVDNYRNLPDAPAAIIFLVSELSALFGNYGGIMPMGVSKDELKEEFSMILTKISQIGAAAGIHLVVSRWDDTGTDSNFIGSALQRNLTSKIHLGSTPPAESLILMGDAEAADLDWMKWEGRKIEGRGYIKHLGQKGQEFQAAYSDVDWYDKWLNNNPHPNWPGAPKDKG